MFDDFGGVSDLSSAALAAKQLFLKKLSRPSEDILVSVDAEPCGEASTNGGGGGSNCASPRDGDEVNDVAALADSSAVCLGAFTKSAIAACVGTPQFSTIDRFNNSANHSCKPAARSCSSSAESPPPSIANLLRKESDGMGFS